MIYKAGYYPKTRTARSAIAYGRSPREALARLEDVCARAGIRLPKSECMSVGAIGYAVENHGPHSYAVETFVVYQDYRARFTPTNWPTAPNRPTAYATADEYTKLACEGVNLFSHIPDYPLYPITGRNNP